MELTKKMLPVKSIMKGGYTCINSSAVHCV